MKGYSLRARVTAKDKVVFEDESLNTRLEDSVYENLDCSYSIDGKLKRKRYRLMIDTGFENELFEVKITDTNTGDKYGSLKAFFPNRVNISCLKISIKYH